MSDEPDEDWTPPELRVDFKKAITPTDDRRALYWEHFDIGRRRQEARYADAWVAHAAWAERRREAEAAK